jgi:hypothetical protein
MSIYLVGRRLALGCLLALIVVGALPSTGAAARPQPGAISYWGLNAYLTKRERLQNGDNLTALRQATQDAGMQWTREELPWDLIEPAPDMFETVYDASLTQAAGQGFGIIGMLLTTPGWARDGSCRPSGASYWCPPANASDFAQFAGWMAERYDGDGQSDAPGSPRIAAWEIWNEPNFLETWPNIGGDANTRKRRYGELLVAAYAAIKAADPPALVLTGGAYIYDGSCPNNRCDGFNFFNASGGVFQQVPAARQAFDVFAIHPYIPDRRPDDPVLPRIITLEGRIANARKWLTTDIGRPAAPIWITEIGWCTPPGNCGGGAQVGEAQQADYLIRSLVIAQQSGLQHASWFQLDDAFNDPNRPFATAALVHDYDGTSYPPKPAYTAYRTLATQLGAMTPAGAGPLNTHIYDPAKPNDPIGVATYDYRYACGAETLDVLWRPNDQIQATLPVAAGAQVTLIHRDGSRQNLLPVSGGVKLTVSESPILVRQAALLQLSVAPESLTLLAQTGDTVAYGGIQISSVGCEPAEWSASVSGAALTLDSTSGVTPASLLITANIQGLASGTHSLGNITITGANGAGTFTRPVMVKIVDTLYHIDLPAIRR